MTASTIKELAQYETSHKYLIEEKGVGKNTGKSIWFVIVVVIHMYIILWLISNADSLMVGILASVALSLFFMLIYLPLFIIRRYYISEEGIVIQTALCGKYNKITAGKVWNQTKDTTYKRLSKHKIRLGFWTSRIDTSSQSRTILSIVFNFLTPIQSIVGSRAVYIVKGSTDEIDFIEGKLSGIARKATI